MLQQVPPRSDPKSYLSAYQPDMPVHFYAREALIDRLQQFQAGFPGMVTYAVKANPAPEVLSDMIGQGIAGFDVASPDEIDLIRQFAPNMVMHYNNPVRGLTEIDKALNAGIRSWAVDDLGELGKLIAKGAGPGHEAAIRFKLPVDGGHYNFGEKFGATEGEAVILLQRAVEAGFDPALTFHVGTQCRDPEAYRSYINAAIRIAKSANVQVKRLNVGGGFPSARDGQPVDLTTYFQVIKDAVQGFDTLPALICEPGRGLVADAFAYGVRVKSVRAGRVYLNDGIYGGLSEFPSMILPRYRVIGADGADKTGITEPMRVFGPTCDSLDQLPDALDLPTDLSEGDWLLFSSMGAYLNGVTTRFNGYGDRVTIPVASLG